MALKSGPDKLEPGHPQRRGRIERDCNSGSSCVVVERAPLTVSSLCTLRGGRLGSQSIVCYRSAMRRKMRIRLASTLPSFPVRLVIAAKSRWIRGSGADIPEPSCTVQPANSVHVRRLWSEVMFEHALEEGLEVLQPFLLTSMFCSSYFWHHRQTTTPQHHVELHSMFESGESLAIHDPLHSRCRIWFLSFTYPDLLFTTYNNDTLGLLRPLIDD